MIEWARVGELRSEVGPENFPEVVALFLEETDAAMAALNPDAGPAKVRQALHFLKGAALNLGLRGVVALCRQEERCATCGSPIPFDFVALTDTYLRSRAELLAGLPDEIPGQIRNSASASSPVISR